MSPKDRALISYVVSKIVKFHDNSRYSAELFADALEDGHPRFDRERFLKACGVE